MEMDSVMLKRHSHCNKSISSTGWRSSYQTTHSFGWFSNPIYRTKYLSDWV